MKVSNPKKIISHKIVGPLWFLGPIERFLQGVD